MIGAEQHTGTLTAPTPRRGRAAKAGIRVLVVAEVRLYREGLAAVLGGEDHIEVVGAAPTTPPDAGVLRPDVVLVDVAGADDLGAVRDLRTAVPAAQVIALAVPDREGAVVACAEAGVSGYVTRDQSVEDVVAAVEAVARGEMICSPRMAAMLVRRVAALAEHPAPTAAPPPRLTARELEIVALIDQGLSNKQIARRLSIEVATVKNHVHNVLKKLHVDRRQEAAARVRAHRLGHLPRLDPSLPEI